MAEGLQRRAGCQLQLLLQSFSLKVNDENILEIMLNIILLSVRSAVVNIMANSFFAVLIKNKNNYNIGHMWSKYIVFQGHFIVLKSSRKSEIESCILKIIWIL